jgi:hypothetical protein
MDFFQKIMMQHCYQNDNFNWQYENTMILMQPKIAQPNTTYIDKRSWRNNKQIWWEENQAYDHAEEEINFWFTWKGWKCSRQFSWKRWSIIEVSYQMWEWAMATELGVWLWRLDLASKAMAEAPTWCLGDGSWVRSIHGHGRGQLRE